MSILSMSNAITFKKPGILGMLFILTGLGLACFNAFFYSAWEFLTGAVAFYGDSSFVKIPAFVLFIALVALIFASLSGQFWNKRFFPSFFTNILACSFGITGGLFIMQFLDGRTDNSFFNLLISIFVLGCVGAIFAAIPSRNKVLSFITFLMAFFVFCVAWMFLMGNDAPAIRWTALILTLACIVAPRIAFGFVSALAVMLLAIVGVSAISTRNTLEN